MFSKSKSCGQKRWFLISHYIQIVCSRFKPRCVISDRFWWGLFCRKFITYFIQGFLPGLITTLFLKLLPYVLSILSKFEGHVSLSAIDRYCAIKYYVFVVINVFFGNVIAGSIFEQFKQYIKAPPTYVLFFFPLFVHRLLFPLITASSHGSPYYYHLVGLSEIILQ